MKVLFAAYRTDPSDPASASGAERQFYLALKRLGFTVEIVRSVGRGLVGPERVILHAYQNLTGTKYAKYPLSLAWKASAAVNQRVKTWQPDVVFSIFIPTLVFYSEQVPFVLRLDTTFAAWHRQYPEFGSLALHMLKWQEKRALANATHVLTHSAWNQQSLIQDYGIQAERTTMFPNPAALPDHVFSDASAFQPARLLKPPYRLLFVGRVPHRKGLDTAIAVTQQLNAANIPVTLTVVGIEGDDTEGVHFAGHYQKSDPLQLQQYTRHYKEAHLLLHPARFDPSPMVTSEAAAFGLPTITNDVGGLATSVTDGQSGLVLPANSSVETYVRAIADLLRDEKRYLEICHQARLRFEQELNWKTASEKLAAVLQLAAAR